MSLSLALLIVFLVIMAAGLGFIAGWYAGHEEMKSKTLILIEKKKNENIF